MKRKYTVINVLIFAILLLIIFYREYYAKKEYQRSGFLLDTIVEISVTSKHSAVDAIIDSTFSLMEDYESKLSMYKQGSRIWEINNSDENISLIDEDIYSLLETAGQLYTLTDSLYEVTIGALSEIWDFEEQVIPSPEEIETARSLVGFNRIRFEQGVLDKPPGLKLNLGSLAKGYIVDRAVEFLQSRYIEAGIVNAGGDLRIFGQKKPLKIGIRHPRGEKTEIISILKLQNRSIVTSGDYERFFIQEGKRYHHILNPETGYPSNWAVSVTVISETAVLADALSTALFLLEPEQAIKILEHYPGTEAIIYFEDNNEIKEIHSPGFKQYMRIEDER